MTNAKFCRNLICAGLGALALSYLPLSHAAYGQLTPPAGFTAGVVNTYNAAKAGVTASVELGRIAANAAISVGGKSVPVPVKLPLGPTAARVAAAAIYLNPGLRTIAVIAAWIGAGMVYDAASGLWKRPDPDAIQSNGYLYGVSGTPIIHRDPAAACRSFYAGTNGNGYYYQFQSVAGTSPNFWCEAKYGYSPSGPFDYNWSNSLDKAPDTTCPAGWYVTPAGCVQTAPMQTVTKPQFEQMVPDARPMPPEIPNIVPESWPVEAPEIQPLFIPTGNPVPNPKYDPAKPQTADNMPYNQPGVKVVPAPTVDNPWQVDLQPVDRPVASPEAKPDPVPEKNPDGTPKPDPGDKPKEDKDERDLCEKNPDILACQKVDTDVESEQIPKAENTVTYVPENIWGGGSCPADQYTRVGGQQLKVADWSRDCQFIVDYVKPVAVVITLLIVAGILAGALKP